MPLKGDSRTTRSGEAALEAPSYARVGQVFAGKFRVERVLGRGGMGVVVAASHEKLRQTVAIKFLLPSSVERARLAARLLREARAAAALKGKHVARVFDIDVVDGAPYIVMEYLEGQTLASLLEANGPLEPALTVDYALEACEALAEAHALGIVHRDLKPSNLFLARMPGGRQTLRVLDFGISKALDDDRGDVSGGPKSGGQSRDVSTFSGTDSHALVGSPPYVSPEQLIRPREADARSDIWSLGVVLYQCLSGRLPFHGEPLTRLWDAILREPMPALGETERPVSPELEGIVRRCLEKDPARRYADVRELARELAPWGSQRARSSLEVIEALAVDEPQLRRASSGESGNRARDQDGTLTESPTTRERPPDETGPTMSLLGFPLRVKVLAVGAAVLAGAVLLLVPSEQRVASPSSQPSVSPKPVRVPVPALPIETISKAPAVPTVSTAPDRNPRPRPRSHASLARTSSVRREIASDPIPSATVTQAPAPVSMDVLARAEELLGKGQISEACAVGQVAAGTSPDAPKVLEFLGRCYMRLGSLEQARSYYRRYLEVAPAAPNAAFVRAILEPKPR